jgi:hypothetical protein
VFTALDREAVEALYQLMVKIELYDEQDLFKAGDPADIGMYIVLNGSLEVYTTDDHSERIHIPYEIIAII